jgi:hypothetical protein
VDGLEFSLSAAAKYMKEKLGTANQSGAYQGGQYFAFENEKLTDMRRRLNL